MPAVPPSGSAHPWQRLFIGREDDLRTLLDHFEKAQGGDPQLVVLLGAAGLGKTRLVQALYECLAAHPEALPGGRDPDDYWPDKIAVGPSLDVNPAFPPDAGGPRPAIPFLWWGLRWSDAGQVNDASAGCALLNFRAKLEPHADPLRRARAVGERRTGLAWAAGKALAGLVPGVGAALPAWDAAEIGRELYRTRGLAAAAEGGVGAAEARERTRLADFALDFFRAVLAPDDGKTPPIAAVLVLDNAQAATGDAETLAFVKRLATEAKRAGWPLMVLATHWKKEWREGLRDRGHAADDPRRFTDLCDLPNLPARPWAEREVRRIPDLAAVVRVGLPGLTEPQVALVAEQAGGNPRLLDQIVLDLRDEPGLFAEDDPDGPLTAAGEEYVWEEPFEVHRQIAKRYARLPREVRRALGWSSVQGARFLTDLTRAAARRGDPALTEEALEEAVRAADDPHSFVEFPRPPADPGRYDLGEFREAAVLKAVRDRFAHDPGQLDHARVALKETLTAWLNERPTAANPAGGAKIDDLPPEECRLSLSLARTHLKPTAEEPGERAETSWQVWGEAVCREVADAADDFRWDDAVAAAVEFADARDWAESDLSPGLMQAVGLVLRQFRNDRRACVVLAARAEIFERRLPAGDDEKLVSARFTVLTDWGRAAAEIGDRSTAARCFRRAVASIEERIRASDESREMLRHLAVGLNDLGSFQEGTEDFAGAEECFFRALRLSRKILRRTRGGSNELRTLAISACNAGRSRFGRDPHAWSCVLFRKALNACRELCRRGVKFVSRHQVPDDHPQLAGQSRA